MKKILAIVALLAVVIIAYSQSGGNKENTLRIGTEGGYMPWNGVDASDEVIGFEIDLAKALCTKLSMSCEFVKQDWDGMIPALLNKKYDVIMAGMAITDSRREKIDFSKGYADTGIAFASIKIKDVQSIEQLKKSLKGKVIGVQTGSVAAQYTAKVFTDSKVRTYGTQDELNIDLLSGRIDAGTNDTSVWYDLQSKKSSVKIVSPILTGADDKTLGEGIGIGIAKGNDELLAKLNEALDSMRADGSLAKLATKWFGFDSSLR